MAIWTMGINQSTHGSDGVVAINNLNLITGNIGKPGGTGLSITGQCNAMGTREWSSCSGLPGYRALEKEKHRETIAKFWGIDPEFFPKQRGLFMTDIFPAIETGQIKALWLVATNPMTSMPNTAAHRARRWRTWSSWWCRTPMPTSRRPIRARLSAGRACGREKEGVFTNTERRVNLVRKVMEPHGDSKPDLWIFNQMAKRFEQGRKMRFPETAAEVFDEMRELSNGPHARLSPA